MVDSDSDSADGYCGKLSIFVVAAIELKARPVALVIFKTTKYN